MSSAGDSNDSYSSDSDCGLFHDDSDSDSFADSNSFADFDSFKSDDNIEDLPSFGCIFKTEDELVQYAQDWGVEAGYPLVKLQSTRDRKTGEKDRVYLQCDRGGKLKPGQEVTRLIGCQFQLAGH